MSKLQRPNIPGPDVNTYMGNIPTEEAMGNMEGNMGTMYDYHNAPAFPEYQGMNQYAYPSYYQVPWSYFPQFPWRTEQKPMTEEEYREALPLISSFLTGFPYPFGGGYGYGYGAPGPYGPGVGYGAGYGPGYGPGYPGYGYGYGNPYWY